MNRYKLFKLMLIILLPCLQFSILHAESYHLAIGAIFKNEKPYLKEWIEFHRLVGVEHFYLYNNASTDQPEKVLAPYIEMGIVELVDWSHDFKTHAEWSEVQYGAYNDILKRAKNVAKWVAFIDIDEFLFPSKKNNLQAVLKEFEPFGGVAVNWQYYGTSHVNKIPRKKLLIEKLVYKAATNNPHNKFIKSIVQPIHVDCFKDVHYAEYKEGFFQVDTNKQQPGSKKVSSKVLIDKIRINHYWTRDEDYFKNYKLPSRKKRGWLTNRDEMLAEQLNKQKDTSILRFVPKLRKKMKSAR
jgi:hypothetical protein